MGSCLSMLPWGRVVNGLSERLSAEWSYVRNLEENLEGLKNAMAALKRKRVYVQEKVRGEVITNRRQMRFQVREWVEGVQTIETDFDNLIRTSETELERLCLCGVFSEDVVSSCRYGKRVSEALNKVKSLSQEEFTEVTEPTPIARVDELPIDQGTIVGQKKLIDTVWECLMDDEVGIVGLYGMGGVGKTTLLKQINNKFLEISDRFDKVIWVVVSQNASVHAIQGSIGKKLDLLGKEWDENDENERAVVIHRALKEKKFVLLLDDIWKDWDLSKIGVPSRVTGCKVAFTTRSGDVCASMKAHHQIEVRCLDSKEAWDLFKLNVGESTLETHTDIPKLAREVAGECRGLPLALTVIGKTMASKTTVQEWHHAINVLKSYASKFAGMVEAVLPILKYSYEDLKDKHVQSCFLYCSLYPEDYLMKKEELIGYWIAEGFIDEKEGREMAYNEGYSIIGTLVRASLLLEKTYSDIESKVKMHDVVRDMALWIASDPPEKHKERYVSKGGLGLNEVPNIKDWRAVQRLSLMENNIRKISKSVECPELTTLLLPENRPLESISGEFFRCMPKLLVLDLAKANCLTELPEEILKSVSLRYLDLSATPIRQLCLEKLKTLIHLDLFSTWALESLEGISNLVSLRTLKLRHSKVLAGESLMKELLLLQHLEYVSIDISSSLVVGGEQYSRIWSSIQELRIREHPEESVTIITLNLPEMKNMWGIWIENCKLLGEIKIERRAGEKSSCLFSYLRHVVIDGCHGIKDLTWLLLAPNVSFLSVQNSSKIEEIISKEKAAMFSEKGTDTTLPFQNLVRLYLHNLPELKSVYWKPLPTQHLIDRSIKECPKLRVKWDDDDDDDDDKNDNDDYTNAINRFLSKFREFEGSTASTSNS